MTSVFAFAYKKLDKKIVLARSDTYSENAIPVTAQAFLENYCDLNHLDIHDFTALEMPFDKNRKVYIGMHLYNEITQQIEVDPSYIPPPSTGIVTPQPT
jgi:hypothetical protein